MDAQNGQQQQLTTLTDDFLSMITSNRPGDDVAPVYQPDEESLQHQVSVLRRCWRYERGCPLLLPYPKDYIEPILTFLRDQENAITLGQYSDDPRSFYELELERLRYLVNDFHRTRLRKIELKPLYYANDVDGRDKLSAAELGFAEGYAKLVQKLMRTGLEGLPGKYSFESVQYETPIRDEVVIFHHIPGKDAQELRLDFGDQDSQTIQPNTVVIAPYDSCEDLVTSGELDVV